MATDGNTLEPIKTNGNRLKPMATDGNQWKPIRTEGHVVPANMQPSRRVLNHTRHPTQVLSK